MARSHEKGARGEREVVAMFRDEGYPGTMRSPGSGSLRSYGAGSPSPFPGDVIVKRDEYARPEPLLVEVKYDERVAEGGIRTWPGSTFITATLRDLAKEAGRTKIIGASHVTPVLWARSARVPWHVWVEASLLLYPYLYQAPVAGFPIEGWSQVMPDHFFELILPLTEPVMIG